IDILSRHFHGVKLENLESDKKVSEFLLKNYPDIITSIKLQDPKNISIGNMTLFEAADKIEKNDTHGNYTFVSKMLVGFISGPEIRDSFDHEYSENKNSVKNKRQEFIQKFKDGKNGPLRTFFDSNRFKYKNLREIVDTSVYELLEVDFPKELDSQRAELYEKISTPKGIAQRAYDFMDDKEKEDAVAKVDEIARKTLEDILQKHLS
ncbi:MAG: hypothetical protein RL687_425, partial [Candidatus Parcubacteria bacterium]